MRNENILPFIGVSLDSGKIYEMTMYCTRGSLEASNFNQENVLINAK
jgi:hypothetical protein